MKNITLNTLIKVIKQYNKKYKSGNLICKTCPLLKLRCFKICSDHNSKDLILLLKQLRKEVHE